MFFSLPKEHMFVYIRADKVVHIIFMLWKALLWRIRVYEEMRILLYALCVYDGQGAVLSVYGLHPALKQSALCRTRTT